MADEKIIQLLYQVYNNEIEAIGQYMDHSVRCGHLGYAKLAKEFETEAEDEMKHADKIMKRILFLGAPLIYTKHEAPVPTDDVVQMLKNDLALEHRAVNTFNGAIKTAFELGDNGTRRLFEDMLLDEEAHIDKLGKHLRLIEAHGKDYLLETV